MPRSLARLLWIALAPLLASCTSSAGKGPPAGSGGAGAAGLGGDAGTEGPSGGGGGVPTGGGGAGPSGAGGTGAPVVLQPGFSRLTRAEYRATVKDAFGV